MYDLTWLGGGATGFLPELGSAREACLEQPALVQITDRGVPSSPVSSPVNMHAHFHPE